MAKSLVEQAEMMLYYGKPVTSKSVPGGKCHLITCSVPKLTAF